MSLEIADGEFMILVGPSGCGKSTALRMVAGLVEITDGELIIGKTPVGRATIAALGMNDPLIVAARALWVRGGWWPPQD